MYIECVYVFTEYWTYFLIKTWRPKSFVSMKIRVRFIVSSTLYVADPK